jgi:hypothetical protein
VGQMGFEGYQWFCADFAYKARRDDLPHDLAELLELSREIELMDKIMLDRLDNGE